MLEVAHEALFRAWPRLVSWLENNKSLLVWQQRLRASVEQYEESKGRSDFLLRGFPLTEALDWLKKKPDYFSSAEREFVKASRTRKCWGRLAAGALAGLVLMVMGVTVWLWGYSYDHAILKVQARFMSIHLEPEMLTVADGSFRQGDTQGRGEVNEKPIREVTIKSFAMGKFEVTFDEYDRFAIATGRLPLPGDQGWGRGQRPVLYVSWDDTVAYAVWLNAATGKRYRLPTESEWEYAARSKGKDDLWAGTSSEEQLKDYAVYPANSQNKTEPVGKDQVRKPNTLGLYDMSGNVWEWVEDCYHASSPCALSFDPLCPIPLS